MARSASDSPSTPPQRRSPRSGRSPRSARRSSSPYEPYEPDAAASPTDDPTLLPTDDPTLLPIDDVHRIAIVGTGIIGSGWAALFLAHGYEVTAYVRSAQSQTKFLAALQHAHGRLVARGIATASDGWRSVVCTSTLAEAVSTADYVQESVSETLHLKQNILAQIARHARPGVLIGTSSSYLPRSLAAALVCRGHSPERIVTAHPSIPDLDSFVEVYGGGTPSGHARTAWLAGLFGSEGVHMDVVLLQRETPGHALNMFNAAIGATAIALVNGGVCAADDVDKALVHLGGLLVAAGGLSGAMVGMVGGGSEVPPSTPLPNSPNSNAPDSPNSPDSPDSPNSPNSPNSLNSPNAPGSPNPPPLIT